MTSILATHSEWCFSSEFMSFVTCGNLSVFYVIVSSLCAVYLNGIQVCKPAHFNPGRSNLFEKWRTELRGIDVTLTLRHTCLNHS